ncbi:Uncharacterised protein [Moraxella lacunata]|uniref:Uncharacterized protein n=1 Tax=Moraxella lacunata TaxID=477 RepID=A0A378TTQ8_MORLA|nr:Uncharacterised protein [Moraxella lacunata]
MSEQTLPKIDGFKPQKYKHIDYHYFEDRLDNAFKK